MEIVDSVRRDKLAAHKAYMKKVKTYKMMARHSHDDITNMKLSLRHQKLAREEGQRRQNEQMYVQRMKKELSVRKKKQKDIKRLEEQEANLIQRLQNAQLMQEDALSGLQYLLTSRATA